MTTGLGSRSPRPFLRRLAVLAAGLVLLAGAGLGLLLVRWWGERGAPPSGRLYVHGDFEGDEPLVVMTRQTSEGLAEQGLEQRDCFDVLVPSTGTSDRLCRGRGVRLWVGDALLDFTLGSRGTPRLSTAGVRLRPGDWLGSLADTRAANAPRHPIRAYGMPSRAARLALCDDGPCLHVDDTLGRLALVRTGSPVQVLAGTSPVLQDGDVLWLGLVPFAVTIAGDGIDRSVVLERSSARGGDRRWLGRLWHAEVPDADPDGSVPDRFEIRPMRVRYTPYNLSRQRTGFEGEDVLQRLVDGGWLCLDDIDTVPSGGPRGGNTVVPQIVWRPFEAPGCDLRPATGTQLAAAKAGMGVPASVWTPATVARTEDYRRARFGNLSYLSSVLVHQANEALAEGRYLEDATILAFAFDWRLRHGRDRFGQRSEQPQPYRLWGVRFGAVRQIRRQGEAVAGRLPAVLPRESTARHLMQVLDRRDELLTTFYLAGASDTGGKMGAVCLGSHQEPEVEPEEDNTESNTDAVGPVDIGPLAGLRPASGRHHPLGSIAFTDDPLTADWSPSAETACDGCRLLLKENDGLLEATIDGDCDGIANPSQTSLDDGDVVNLGTFRLRHARRGERPWLAATDPGTGRRLFADELHLGGGLRPIVGDATGLSGVEAALREYVADAGAIDGPAAESFELTIDGDLQLTATAIVEALARPEIEGHDPAPESVSVTVAILDARGGDLLAAVNFASANKAGGRLERRPPTSWELGSGQADVLQNPALRRRGAIGSTMKITGAYTLVNSGSLVPGPEIELRRRGTSFVETDGEKGAVYLDRGDVYPDRRRERPNRRRCSTGPHILPAGDAGYTTGTFVKRFAASCNNFFVMTGLRHIGSEPLRLTTPHGGRPIAGELQIDDRARGQVMLRLADPGEDPLVERLRDGLAVDFGDDDPSVGSTVPRSLYGVLMRLGFQPRPDLDVDDGEVPADLQFAHGGRQVRVPLVHDWFAPSSGDAGPRTPALRRGRDFSYLGVPSPARLDESTLRYPPPWAAGEPVTEIYDGRPRQVRRLPEGRADVQWSMLMIGQSGIEASALGLATLYAPAARVDGRAVSPCLFRDNCGDHRAGARVLDTGPLGGVRGDDTAQGAVLNEALASVLSPTGGSGRPGTGSARFGSVTGSVVFGFCTCSCAGAGVGVGADAGSSRSI